MAGTVRVMLHGYVNSTQRFWLRHAKDMPSEPTLLEVHVESMQNRVLVTMKCIADMC